MKIKIMLFGNGSQHYFIDIPKRTVFVFFHVQGLHIFASTLSDFRQSACLA
jgi:hypothetical protein